ncbi:hypothetical protein E5676_scaffold32G00570 [Cucumis melo var. makuwa]|uniref:Uncharacterized protein n=1 Tax=Cucumis melo var. makuwa TaxID=1194695 RepID=A0A5A7TIS7_CUCMM|nr:hypothetical protein E6C27_scaffold128G002250 [Cucumis melo var. makuwa]TYK16048.1 hypothetical protein E5676_scaffold32G00570 [Cucumis melo var. makuwa]
MSSKTVANAAAPDEWPCNAWVLVFGSCCVVAGKGNAGRKRNRPNCRSQRRNSPVWPSRGEDEWQEKSGGGQKMALALLVAGEERE